MQFWYVSILFVLAAIIFALTVKICMLRKNAGEIGEAFEDRLQEESNTWIGISGSDRYMRKLARDINIQLERLNEERQRYCQGDAEVKNAITNLSHDLRTPLTSIWGYLELLEEEELPADAARYVRIIKNRTELLKEMTEELFDFSVDTSAKLELKCEAVDINRVLQESIAAFYTNFQERGITPHIRMPERRIICMADTTALMRVFANLLNNALKYSDGDLEIDLSESGEIIFANTAANLSHVEVERLFDRFYTVENARRSRGLGLSIAKLFMENMNGKITAEYTDRRLVIRLWLPEADQ